jgi:antitoxin ChpS
MASPKDKPARKARPADNETPSPRGTRARATMLAGSGPALGAGYLGKTKLKKAGGSLVMTVPASARKMLNLEEGQEMAVKVEGERLVVEAAVPRPKYALDELMAQCDLDEPMSEHEQAWLNDSSVGREAL